MRLVKIEDTTEPDSISKVAITLEISFNDLPSRPRNTESEFRADLYALVMRAMTAMG
jgi:hypothetical protein